MERVGCGVEQTVKVEWWWVGFVLGAPGTGQDRIGQGAALGGGRGFWLATRTSSCSGALSPRARPGSPPSVCPYPTQARLAVADAPPAEAGALPVELLCGLQERKLRVPRAPACPPPSPCA